MDLFLKHIKPLTQEYLEINSFKLDSDASLRFASIFRAHIITGSTGRTRNINETLNQALYDGEDPFNSKNLAEIIRAITKKDTAVNY